MLAYAFLHQGSEKGCPFLRGVNTWLTSIYNKRNSEEQSHKKTDINDYMVIRNSGILA